MQPIGEDEYLIGPSLYLALDARQTGIQSRSMHGGCRCNAILRPVLSPRKKRSMSAQRVEDDVEHEDEDALTLGLLRLCMCLLTSARRPHHLHQYRQQMTSMLHTLRMNSPLSFH